MSASCAQAANHPFAIGARESAGAPSNGLVGWILYWQSVFHQSLTAAVRQAVHEPGAFFALAGLCLAYGLFHAAGPGHGKAVISSYLIANERTLRRALAMTFLAAMLQAAIAIAIVGAGAAMLNATAASMTRAAEITEIVCYAATAALGLWLVLRKGRALARLRSHPKPQPSLRAASQESARAQSRFTCEAAEADAPASCLYCGISHAPDPALISGDIGWRRMSGAIIAAGARPCSGAILVLVFALSQGAFWIGVGGALAMGFGVALATGALAALSVLAKNFAIRLAKTQSARGAAMIGFGELIAACLVLAFGLAMLLGSLDGAPRAPVF